MKKNKIKKILQYFGYEFHRVPILNRSIANIITPKYERVHYGCGYLILDGWLNLDIINQHAENYFYVNLIDRHPFPDNTFKFAFSEDFIEHIDQASSLIFLVEVYRTLMPGGVFRITTPSLDNVLSKHFQTINLGTFQNGCIEAFSSLGHIHFYSITNLVLIANHIGFDVAFVKHGESKYPELNGIDTRSDFVYLHAELTKR